MKKSKNPIIYFCGYGELRNEKKVYDNLNLRIKKLLLKSNLVIIIISGFIFGLDNAIYASKESKEKELVFDSENYITELVTDQIGEYTVMYICTVIDGFNGIRNNSYLGFRSWQSTGYSDKYVVSGGNRYGYN